MYHNDFNPILPQIAHLIDHIFDHDMLTLILLEILLLFFTKQN